MVKKKRRIVVFILAVTIYYFVFTEEDTQILKSTIVTEDPNFIKVEDGEALLVSSSYFRRQAVTPSLKRFDYDISPLNSGYNDPFLVIMVPSVPRRRKRRQAIRETWGSIAHGRKWPGSDLHLRTNLIFLVGHSSDESEDKIVEEDSTVFGDILRGTFADSYHNLTLKVLTGLMFVTKRYPNVEYILKADDDTFTNIDLIVRMLQTFRPKNSVLGYIHPKGQVERSGMWQLSPEVYPFLFFPAYAAGNAYVISGDMAECVCGGATLFPYIFIEDAFITGILAIFCNSSRLHQEGFTKWMEESMSPGEFVKRNKITMNRVNGEADREIWAYLKKNYNGSRNNYNNNDHTIFMNT